jgi:hypothetical protein
MIVVQLLDEKMRLRNNRSPLAHWRALVEPPLEGWSSEPLLEASRALLAAGHDPAEPAAILRPNGIESLRARSIGEAAKLTVREGSTVGPVFAPYVPVEERRFGDRPSPARARVGDTYPEAGCVEREGPLGQYLPDFALTGDRLCTELAGEPLPDLDWISVPPPSGLPAELCSGSRP